MNNMIKKKGILPAGRSCTACPKETAYRTGTIGAEQGIHLAGPPLKNDYGRYLVDMTKGEVGP